MNTELDDAEEGDDFDDDRYQPLSLKYCFEGVETLTGLASSLRALADEFDAQAAAGWRLESPVESGWAHLGRES